VICIVEKVVSCVLAEMEMTFNISELLENDESRKLVVCTYSSETLNFKSVRFYLNSLVLLCSVCSHGNETEAAEIKKKLNKDLLLKCLQIEGIYIFEC